MIGYYSTLVISPNVVKFWIVPMFTYGFLRTYRSEYPIGFHHHRHKIVWSLFRAMWYVSPAGILSLMDTVHRARIKWTAVDPSMFPSCYTDGITYNPNVLV